MFTKKIFTFFLTTNVLIHAAAERPDEKITFDDLIGYAFSPRGNFSIIPTFETEGEPFCSITLAYSEHHLIKNPDILNDIAQTIDQKKSADIYTLGETLEALTDAKKAMISPALEDRSQSDCVPVQEAKPGHNLIALFIKLSGKHVSFSWSDQINRVTGTYEIEKKDKSAVSNGYAPLSAKEPVSGSPKAHAEMLQQNYAYRPFHVVLNLENWRLIRTRAKAAAKEQKQTQDSAAKLIHTQSCLDYCKSQ